MPAPAPALEPARSPREDEDPPPPLLPLRPDEEPPPPLLPPREDDEPPPSLRDEPRAFDEPSPVELFCGDGTVSAWRNRLGETTLRPDDVLSRSGVAAVRGMIVAAVRCVNARQIWGPRYYLVWGVPSAVGFFGFCAEQAYVLRFLLTAHSHER